MTPSDQSRKRGMRKRILSQKMFLKARRGFSSMSGRRELPTLLGFFNLAQHENQWRISPFYFFDRTRNRAFLAGRVIRMGRQRIFDPFQRNMKKKPLPGSYQQATMAPMLDWSQCSAVERVPGKVSGVWVFKGTRVPVRALFENLEGGATVNEFLKWFPGVTHEQVVAVLEQAEHSLVET
jgi:uncharacterized protein (DUF433 family)